MTKQGVIMTIEVLRFISTDLYAENASLLFDSKRVDPPLTSVPPLGAVTFTAERTDPSQNLQDLAVACGREAFLLAGTTYSKAYRAWLFISDGPWKEATKIVQHQKLWKNHRDLVETGSSGRKSDEVAIEVGSLVRYAGLLEITDGLTEKAINSVRTCSSYAIILSSRHDIILNVSIRYIFSQAFTKQNGIERTSIDWMTLAIALCPQGDVLMRVSGLFDDREAAVDLIAIPQNLPALD